MKIETLSIKNFRGIKNKEFCFDDKNIVFFGINGAGKSSLLKIINLLFSNIINKIVNNRFKQGINLEIDDISFGESKCDISFQCLLGNERFSYSRSMLRKEKTRNHNKKQLDEFCSQFQQKFCADENSNMPIFVNYGVNRLVLDIPLRIRNKHEFDKLSAFEKSIYSTIDFRTFFEWFRYQEDLENQMKVEKKDLEYIDKSLQATREAITTILEGTTNLRVDRNPLAMKVDKNGVSLNVNQLSDGEKCTLALMGDLTRRLALANPSLDNPLLGEGIALIDEIELHMHPSWQRKIISVLRKVFPNVQFIITTHSPQVLGEVGESFKLYELENTDGFEVREYDRLDGWDSNDILETLMETSHINERTAKEFVEVFDYIRVKDFDKAESALKQIKPKIHNKNPDFLKAKSLIALGRRLK